MTFSHIKELLLGVYKDYTVDMVEVHWQSEDLDQHCFAVKLARKTSLWKTKTLKLQMSISNGC